METIQPLTYATFWQGPIDPITYTCLASFPYRQAKLKVYSYDQKIDVPKGVEVSDARTIVPDESLMTRYILKGKPSLARFTNLFRYLMIQQTDHCWVDADILCVKNPSHLNGEVIFGRQEFNTHSVFNVAVLKFPSDHPVLKALIDEAERRVDESSIWGTLGPRLLTHLVRTHKMQPLAYGVKNFYPLHYRYFWKALLPSYHQEALNLSETSTFIHLWNQMYKSSGYDLYAAPPENSLLHKHCLILGTLHRFERLYESRELRQVLGDYVGC